MSNSSGKSMSFGVVTRNRIANGYKILSYLGQEAHESLSAHHTFVTFVQAFMQKEVDDEV